MMMPNDSYAFVFEFEKDLAANAGRRWMSENWHKSWYFVGAYLLFIVSGQHYMKPRPKFELRKTLALWNFFLAAFSIIGATRTVPELIHVLRTFGLHHSCCVTGQSFMQNNVLGLWMFLFTLSKVLELGDTVFIILRKQPLIFLHWFHHATVLLFTWFSYAETLATSRWMSSINYSVHAVMYSYYAFKSLRFRVPKVMSVLITSGQLTQFTVAGMINVYAYYVKLNGGNCDVSYVNLNLTTVLSISYIGLFAHFFHKAYLAPKESGDSGAANGVVKKLQ